MPDPLDHPRPSLAGLGPDDAAPTPARRRLSRRTRNWIEWAVVIVVALAVSVGIRSSLVQTFSIPSASMDPTLEVGDRILVDKRADHLSDLERGDIVVFERPPTLSAAEDHLVKRLIGLPGDSLEGRDGDVYVNGKLLDEPWLPEAVVTEAFGPVTVPDGQIFMMGDNRGNSQDSRVFGAIDADLVTGRAFFRIWPLGRAGGL